MLNFILVPRHTTWECYNDEECGSERACIDRACVNPCLDACGAGALCRVIDHKPQCSCPRGYSGVATLHCVPRMYLKQTYFKCISGNSNWYHLIDDVPELIYANHNN